MDRVDHTHAAFEESLLSLESLAERVGREPRAADARTAGRILDCFDRTAPEHHRAEENVLFPELRTRAVEAGRPELCGALYELETEHRRMEALYREALRPALERIAAGTAADLDPGAVANFVWIYRRHIRMEADVLEPFAAQSHSHAA